jgi:hypothetical protein
MARRRKKSRKSSRRRRKGMGSIITVRRKGMGQLNAETLMPVAVGGGMAALTTLALRWFVEPTNTTQSMLVKWAPAAGMVTGSLAALALNMMGGARSGDKATRAFLSATVVSLAGLANDYLLRQKPALAATIASSGSAMAGYGMGAIVPEYSRGMGAIVMEPVGASGQRAGTIGQLGSYGETVNLAGVNVSAFGTPGFNA